MSDTEKPEYLNDEPEMVSWSPSEITLGELRIDPHDLVAFLARLSVTGNVSEACKVSRISRPTVYRLKREVPSFRSAWKCAIENARDVLEREACRRAVEGVQRKVFQGGREVGVVREYSDNLLTLMLKARHPDYAKTVGKVEVNQAQVAATTPGPPVPETADLGMFIKRLGEVAETQGLLSGDTEDGTHE